MDGEIACEIRAHHRAESILRVHVTGDLIAEVIGSLDLHVYVRLKVRRAWRFQLLLYLQLGTGESCDLIRVCRIGIPTEHVHASSGKKQKQKDSSDELVLESGRLRHGEGGKKVIGITSLWVLP